MRILGADEVQSNLKRLNGWVVGRGEELSKAFVVPDLAHSLLFVSAVGWLADSNNKIEDIRFLVFANRVILDIKSVPFNALTDTDFDLAEAIDAIPDVTIL